MTYEIFDPQVARPLHELSRKDAKAAYDRFIGSIPERVQHLKEHLADSGVEVTDTLSCLEDLHQFFVAKVKEVDGNELPSYIFSLSCDIGMFMGQLATELAPCLQWIMFTHGKNDIAYQRPVISGFKVKNRHFNIDFDYIIVAYAYRLLEGDPEESMFFTRMMESCIDKTQ